MKQSLKKYGALILIIALICAVCLMFAVRKSGMFIDEIYTYGLSNSHYAPFLTDCMEDGSLVDKSLDRQLLWDYVTVNKGEGFDFGSVYFNQVNDVHPPLYYWIFNAVSSLTPGVFSKWTGLIPDMIIYGLCLFVLYKLIMKLFQSRLCAMSALVLYGLSNLGLSTMLMIRMYVLLTLFTVLLAYLIACLMEKPRGFLYPLIGLDIFLGLMTQYYFVFYAFFVCAAYLIYALTKKEYRPALSFTLCSFAGVGLLVAVFPACLEHLFSDKLVSGTNALENLSAFEQYSVRLNLFYHEVQHGLKAAVCIAILLVLLLALSYKKTVSAFKEKRINLASLVIIIPAFISLVVVAIISPVTEQRYVYNIAPIFIVAVCLLMHMLEKALGSLKHRELVKDFSLLVVLAAALFFARLIPPHYLYPEYREYNEALSMHSGAPCVFMTDNYFAPITENLEQLLIFDDVFVTNDPDSLKLKEYLAGEDSDECVVYIDVSEFWSSGYDPEKMLPELIESTDYEGFQPLYENGLSEAFLLTK